MARHLTRCFKPTLLYTNTLNVYEGCTLIRTMKSNFVLNSMAIRRNVSIIVPKYPQIETNDTDYVEVKSYEKFVMDIDCGKGSAARTLIKILPLTKADAEKVVKAYPTLMHTTIKSMIEQFEILREAGIHKTTIIENPFLLTEIGDDLIQKINVIQKIDIDINDAVHLFHLSVHMFKIYEHNSKIDATYLPESNRLRYLAKKLNCDISTVCKWISYNPRLLMLAAPRLMTTTEFFLNSGVKPEYIINDPTAYNYTLSTIKQRITAAKELGIHPLKLWVIRCSPNLWEKCIRRYQRYISHGNTTNVLCDIYDCEQEEIEPFINKVLIFKNISVEKLLRNAKLLRDAGYTIQELQVSPRSVLRRTETLMEFLDICKQHGDRRIPLWLLSLPKERFLQYLMKDL